MSQLVEADFVTGIEIGIGVVSLPDGGSHEIVGISFQGAPPVDEPPTQYLLTLDMAWKMVGSVLDGLASSLDKSVAQRAMDARLHLKRGE